MENCTSQIWKNPYKKRFNEVPLTIVKDLNDALSVTLIKKPQITGALREFVECGSKTRPPVFETAGTSLEKLIKSNALWQGLETLNFMFKVTGCSRMLTHQLVRQRIGITFSQQCSDSVDWRHQNIVLPRSVPKYVVPAAIDMKMLYAKMVDSMNVSCQEARYVLPQCLETFLYIHVNLATLIPMLQKRECTMTQPWETFLWAKLTKAAILKDFPELESAFMSLCVQGKCFYHRAKNDPTSAYLYQPDVEHGSASFTWNPKSYVYPKTHEEMSAAGKTHPRMYYIGNKKIEVAEYFRKADEYDLWK